MCSRPNVPPQLVIPGVARRARVARKGRRPPPNFPNNFLLLNNLPALCRDGFMAPAAVTSFCDPWAVKVGIEELFRLFLWSLSTCMVSDDAVFAGHRRWFLTLTLYAIVDTVRLLSVVAVNARRWCSALLNFLFGKNADPHSRSIDSKSRVACCGALWFWFQTARPRTASSTLAV